MDTSKDSYVYKAPWTVYALGWSNSSVSPWRLALGSFVEEYKNKLRIISLDAETDSLVSVGEADHFYPITKLQWNPKPDTHGDLLATAGDYLRIWSVGSSANPCDISVKSILNNSKSPEYCAPITSIDWNEVTPNIIGTCSIDTTCSIWDIREEKLKTQLIAHDKEVYDMAFNNSADVFASVGADGSVRMFDLRNLEHSTIIYETTDGSPLLRLAWNRQDSNYLATFQMDSSKVIVLDVRVPSIPITELHGHTAAVNACAWAPHSSGHLITVADDSQALVWDVAAMKRYTEEPVLAYCAQSEINQLSWSRAIPQWVSIATSHNTVEVLRV